MVPSGHGHNCPPGPRGHGLGRGGISLLLGAAIIGLAGWPSLSLYHGQAAGAGQAEWSGVLYRPSDTSQFAGYPRVIRLAHGGQANGTLIAIFDVFVENTDRLLIYRSTDDGRTWSHISTLTDTDYAGRMCCPTLFELPRTLGDQAAGTLLLAESAGAAGTVGHEIKVFRSTDQGESWTYLSSCARGPGGLWEPYFSIDSSGRLVCFFADEGRAEYSQYLGHVVSTDGGETWSDVHVDVAVREGALRPGMATVVRLPSGRYVMSFEVCRLPNCEVHVKSSADGVDWGDPADLGERVQTSDGLYAGHTPYLAWTPEGGPQGTLLLSSQDVFGPDGLVAPESRRVLFVNRQGGTGPWSLVAAPVSVPQGGPDCANYSSPLLTEPADQGVLMLAAVGLGGGGCEIRYGRTPVEQMGTPRATPQP
ncbi:MAG: sialidase family protein [Thermomicrobiales bacterium]